MDQPGGPARFFDVGGDGTSFVVDTGVGGGAVVHWGAAAGPELAATAAALARTATIGALDTVAPAGLVPEHGSGYPGRPGLSGRRPGGSAWAPRFATRSVDAADGRVVVVGGDEIAGLTLTTEMTRHHGGAVRVEAELANDGDTLYLLDDLAVTLALPEHVGELVTYHGRWCRELHPRRQPFPSGAYVAENRRGRTSHESPPLLWAGTTGFGEQRGEVWGAHLAWSGNSRVRAERLPDGRPVLTLGELLHPGEVVLAPGESYRTPPVYAVHSPAGMTPASRRFHAVVRDTRRPGPRPVLLNTWEAVYFDHDLATLTRLAERAAAVGVERFVLDDGWFGGRRHDRAGLGDWWVSPAAHPAGLAPLITRVRELGMDFGLWVEPEMVNPDSDLYRAHPDWALTAPGYEPVLGRDQLVLDLTRPDAYAEILGRLDALVGDHDIAFVKWDMNRDHVHPTDATGRAATHAQTAAVYRLFDTLRERHPSVEFESCSSGGARIDLGILARTDRVWTSDCNDALERLTIQQHASTLIPPEVMGCHIGPPTAHTTGRTQSLAFRAATALFGHLGVEWDLLRADDAERAELAAWIALHKRWRALLHHGDVVRVDHDDPHALVYGVLAADRRRALVAYAQLTTAQALAPRPVRVPELTAEQPYRVTLLTDPGGAGRLAKAPSAVAGGIELTGRQLAAHGVRLPVLFPESVALLGIEASEAGPTGTTDDPRRTP